MKQVIEIFTRLFKDIFYGSITFKLEAGKIVHIEEKRSIEVKEE